MKKSILLSIILILTDQLIKVLIRRLPEGSVYCTLPGLAQITHVTNTGAAFSLMSGSPHILFALCLLLLCALSFFLFRRMNLTSSARISAVCLLSGGIGNLIDRLLLGGVTDYIRLIPIRFPIFNFADILVTCSVFALIWLTLRGKLECSVSEDTNE